LQESIVQAICLASQRFRLKPLDECDLDNPGGLIGTPFSFENRGFVFCMPDDGRALNAFCKKMTKKGKLEL
jgi:hypothetical protein